MARVDNYEQRFGGIGRLYTPEGLARLRQAHVCVIGIGGVGSWVVEALARSGVGQITMIDMDDICVTNINRQLPALSGNIGKLKTEVMAERVKLINPECVMNIIDDFISPDNQAEYLNRGYDYVIDAIDNVKTKAAMIAYCKRNKIKIITIGGAGGQILFMYLNLRLRCIDIIHRHFLPGLGFCLTTSGQQKRQQQYSCHHIIHYFLHNYTIFLTTGPTKMQYTSAGSSPGNRSPAPRYWSP